MVSKVLPNRTRSVPPKRAKGLSDHIGLWLACIAFLHGLVYMTLTPPWQAPDEPRHFQYVRFLLDEQRLPTRDDENIDSPLTEQVKRSMAQFDFWTWRDRDIVSPWLEYRVAWGHPPLYYGLAAGVLLPFLSSDVTLQLYIVRLFSVTLTALTVWVAYQIMHSLFPTSRVLAVAVPLFIALLPMHAFVGSIVNNDPLAELTSVVVIWLLVEAFRRGLSWQRGGLLLVALVTALFAKRTTAFLVPLVIFSLLILLPPLGRRWLVVIGIVAFPLGLVLLRQLPGGYISGLLLNRARGVFVPLAGLTLSDMALWGALLFTTFWGNFGWATIQLDWVWYALLLVITLASILGWIRRGWRWRQQASSLIPWQRWILAVFVLATLLILAQTVVLLLLSGIHQQARYIFPAIVPVALFLVLGWSAWLPPSWHRRALILGATMMVVFDLVVLTLYQLPFYYG